MMIFFRINLHLYKYALIILLCISCQKGSKSNTIDSKEKGGTETSILLHDIWILHKIEDISYSETTQKRPQLQFQVTQKKILGNDGCNQFFGKIENLTNSELEFSIMGGTKMRCPNMGAVNTYLELLKKTHYYQIMNLELSLLDANKNVLLVYKKGD